MVPDPGPSFDREYGCTLVEWLRWMPEAVHGHAYTMQADGSMQVVLGGGALLVQWQVLEPRRIAMIRLPRLHVRFGYNDVADDVRLAFQRRFDLQLQRGGG